MTNTLAAQTVDGASKTGSMVFSCWAIVLVLAAMSFVFLRQGKKEYSAAILPLLLTPFSNIIGSIPARFLSRFVPLSPIELRVIIVITAGLFSCLLLGIGSRKIKGHRTRQIFFWCCAAFVIILTLVLVINTMIS